MASLHNFLIFKSPLNYLAERITRRNTAIVVTEMTDNRYTTFSPVNDVDVNIADGAGNATRVDALFFKYRGDLTSVRVTPTGGSGNAFTRTVPDAVTNSQGETVSLETDGFKHDLYLLDTHFTATSVRLEFRGTHLEIYALMLLELLQEINNDGDILNITPTDADRTSQVDPSSSGGLYRSEPIASSREKRNHDLTVKVVPDGETFIQNADELLYFFENNPRVVVAEAFSESPDAVYPAVIRGAGGGNRFPVRYLYNEKWLGYSIEFRVLER